MFSTQKNSYISLNVIVILLVAMSVFVFGLMIDSYYTEGDPSLYRKVYEELVGINLVEGYIHYSINLDSKEFVHFFLSWLASNIGIKRDLFNAVSSAIFAYVAMLVFYERKASIFIAALIVLTNLYFILLYTTTERLKIGMIFFCLSLLYRDKSIRFYFFVFLAIISHTQILILYLSMFFYKFYRELPKLLLKGGIRKELLLIIILFSMPLMLAWEQILSKLTSYYAVRDFTDLIRIVLFLTLSLWYSRNKIEPIIVFFPLMIAIFFLGGERLNMFGYFIFLYYALPVRRGFNIGILLVLVYFLFSSIGFIAGIIEDGIPMIY